MSGFLKLRGNFDVNRKAVETFKVGCWACQSCQCNANNPCQICQTCQSCNSSC